MATKIRLQRFGRRGAPFYRIVIADSRAPRDGKFIERIGSYNPNTNPATIDLKFDRALYWLNVPAKGVAQADLICKEKMCPVMTCLPYTHFDEAIEIANTNLSMEGSGHTAGIHSNNQGNIIKAGDEINISRLIVNAPCSITAGGSIQNGLSVTTTLGCGSWGNNSISENLTYKHLLNISRIARMSPHVHVPTDEEIWKMN